MTSSAPTQGLQVLQFCHRSALRMLFRHRKIPPQAAPSRRGKQFDAAGDDKAPEALELVAPEPFGVSPEPPDQGDAQIAKQPHHLPRGSNPSRIEVLAGRCTLWRLRPNTHRGCATAGRGSWQRQSGPPSSLDSSPLFPPRHSGRAEFGDGGAEGSARRRPVGGTSRKQAGLKNRTRPNAETRQDMREHLRRKPGPAGIKPGPSPILPHEASMSEATKFVSMTKPAAEAPFLIRCVSFDFGQTCGAPEPVSLTRLSGGAPRHHEPRPDPRVAG